MSNPSLPRAKSWASRFDGFFRDDKSGRKNSSRFYPRNPLKSLDSDERIQGNPTLIIGGLRSETATRQENPNRVDQTECRARRREGAKTDSIQRQRALDALLTAAGSFPPATSPSASKARLRAVARSIAGYDPIVSFFGKPAARYRTAHERHRTVASRDIDLRRCHPAVRGALAAAAVF
jgi:hypothetical protein